MLIRLQKYLSAAGVASRRNAETYILEGRIKVNGEIISSLGTKVDDTNDVVEFDGKKVSPGQFIYMMLHKPEGYVTTAADQFSRPTVIDLLTDVSERVYPVGRLDYNTSGLLLLTNDGALTSILTHPKYEIEKVYMAKIFGKPTTDEIKRFEQGLLLDNYKTAPAKIEIIKSEGRFSTVKITIKEGKNRQVRKMCEKINHPVASLKRIATGKIFLGNLPKGKYRLLDDTEIHYLKGLEPV